MNRLVGAQCAFTAFWGGLLLIDLLGLAWIAVTVFLAAATAHGYVTAAVLVLAATSGWQVVFALIAARLIAYPDRWFGLGRSAVAAYGGPYTFVTTLYRLSDGKSIAEPIEYRSEGQWMQGYDVRTRSSTVADYLYGVRERVVTTACVWTMLAFVLTGSIAGYWWLTAFGIAMLGGWAIVISVLLALGGIFCLISIAVAGLAGGTSGWPWLAKLPERKYEGE